jgi:hypothetical protein
MLPESRGGMGLSSDGLGLRPPMASHIRTKGRNLPPITFPEAHKNHFPPPHHDHQNHNTNNANHDHYQKILCWSLQVRVLSVSKKYYSAASQFIIVQVVERQRPPNTGAFGNPTTGQYKLDNVQLIQTKELCFSDSRIQ